MLGCTSAITFPASTSSTDFTEYCKYSEKLSKCYPKCMCDDAEFAKEYETNMEGIKTFCDASTYSLSCGGTPATTPPPEKINSAAGLRATALSTTALAALVAVVAACPR
jgi:hypothetical protein